MPGPPQPRVIIMAFGDDVGPDTPILKNEFQRWEDSEKVLFLAASGTRACSGGIFGDGWDPLYPASESNVLAVGCVDPTTGLQTNRGSPNDVNQARLRVCNAGTLGVAGLWAPEVPAGGTNADDIFHFGGSSSCVATVGGIAALIWAQDPTWTAATVKSRLRQA